MSAASTLSLATSPTLSMVRALPLSPEQVSQMSALEIFSCQLESGNTEAKVDAMKRLHVLAFAMGPEGTLNKLVPYLTQHVAMKQPPHEDEVLLLLATNLAPLVPNLLNGEQALQLLPILERLAAVEETVVRDEAVKTLTALTNHFPAHGSSANAAAVSTARSALVGMAKRLVAADWFTPKVSAAGMLAPIYKVTQDIDMISLYKELCQDETPMVRRSAASHIGTFLSALSSPGAPNNSTGTTNSSNSRRGSNSSSNLATTTALAQELIAPLVQLAQDEQDSVRLLAVASLAQVGDAYGKAFPDWTCEYFLPILKAGATDTSWRVRNNLAKCFSSVAVNLGVGAANVAASSSRSFSSEQALVMSCFVALLTDVEPEVRAASVGHFARMVHWAGQVLFVRHLQPLLPQLADDVVMEVRSKTALAVMEASQGGTLEDAVILQVVGPLLENFLQDEYPEVQLQVLSNLATMSHLLADMNGVVAALLHMSKASNWRVRQAVATLLPHLAQARGLDYFVSVLLEPTWLTLLLDPVATVRNACVSGMSILTQVGGPDWMIQNMEPHHIRIYHANANNYLVRMTIVRAHIETALAASKCSSPILWQDVVQKISGWGLSDKVVNVRMLAAEGLYRIVQGTQESSSRNIAAAATAMITTTVRPALEQSLQREEDDECRRCLLQAVEACSAA